MYAVEGDRLVIKHTRPGKRERDGEVVEVRGPKGAPPYLVRWAEDGRIGLVFPGPDAQIKRTQGSRRGD